MNDSMVRVTHRQNESGDIAFVTLNRTHKRNAFDSELLQATQAAMAQVSVSGSLRLVVLQSACEGVFSAGADVREMAALDAGSAAQFIQQIHAVCQSIVDCPVPVLAVVDGLCVGGALEIVASCDLRLATSRARFCMPEVLVGLPSVVEAARLPQLIGFGRTRRLLYTGETIDANTAERWGLVEYCCEPEQLQVQTEDLIKQMQKTAPRAVRLQKSLIRQWEMLDLDDSIQAGVKAFEQAFEEPEAQHWLAEQAARLNKPSV